MIIRSANRLRGRLSLPGDKSISHRAAMLAAIADGPSQLHNFSTSQDCASTLECLRALGVDVERIGNEVRIEGRGARGLRAPATALDCGNSGSTMRMLPGILAGQDFVSTLTGDESLSVRPMARIIEPLELMGVRVASENARPPLRIEPPPSLSPISYELPVASAQVKSCVLLAGLYALGRTTVSERVATRDHTERLLRWFGVPLEIGESEKTGTNVSRAGVNGPAHLSGREVNVPGDISSAAFLIAAAALLPGSELEINGVGLNPTRAQILSTLDALGLSVETLDVHNDCNEPVGTVAVRARKPWQTAKPHLVRGSVIPSLIDELPLLAVVGTQINGGIEIRDARELRVKETDRIAATVTNLRRLGAEVEEYEDGLRVGGPTQLKGALLDSFGDHRIAMAFAVAALFTAGETQIAGADCVAISFPEFYALLDKVVER